MPKSKVSMRIQVLTECSTCLVVLSIDVLLLVQTVNVLAVETDRLCNGGTGQLECMSTQLTQSTFVFHGRGDCVQSSIVPILAETISIPSVNYHPP